jgi:PAS domain-containing protein
MAIYQAHATAIGMSRSALQSGSASSDGSTDVARLALNSRGVIRDCNRAAEVLFQTSRLALLRRHVSLLLPQLAHTDLIKNGQINPHLRFLSRIGRDFETVRQDGERFPSRIFLSALGGAEGGELSLIVRPATAANEA